MCEEEKDLVSCQICKEMCKRGVSVKCCGTRACRACATKKVTSSRFCWNDSCKVPMSTDALQNDDFLRSAVEHIKAGTPIPNHILLKLKENRQNGHKRALVSDDVCNDIAKKIKTEEQSIQIKHEPATNIKVESISEQNCHKRALVSNDFRAVCPFPIKDEPKSEIKQELKVDPDLVDVSEDSENYDEPKSEIKQELKVDPDLIDVSEDSENDDDDIGNEEEMFKTCQSIFCKKMGELKGLTKIFVSTLFVRKKNHVFPLYEIGAFNPSTGHKYKHSFPRETAMMRLRRQKMEAGKWVEKKRKNNKGNRKPRESHLEPGIQGFCKFLVQESKLKDKMVLIFYTKFEMCAFLTRIKQLYFYQQQFWELGLQRGEKTIGLLQKIGVDYFSHLQLSPPIQPLNQAVSSNIGDEDMETAAINLSHYCAEDQMLQCYGITPFVFQFNNKPKGYAEMYAKVKFTTTGGGQPQMMSCLHIPGSDVIPGFRKDKRVVLKENLAAGKLSNRQKKRLEQRERSKLQQQGRGGDGSGLYGRPPASHGGLYGRSPGTDPGGTGSRSRYAVKNAAKKKRRRERDKLAKLSVKP